MINKNSIISQITIFFLIVFVLINAIIFVQFLLDNHNNKLFQVKRYKNAVDIVINSKYDNLKKEQINKKIKAFNLKLSDVNLYTLITSSEESSVLENAPIELFIYKNKKYVHIKPPDPRLRRGPNQIGPKLPPPEMKDEPIIFIDLISDKQIVYFWLIVLVLIDSLLIWFYYFLFNKLKPLLKLKEEIAKFSDGNLNINTKVTGNDEIAQVSNEFNNAIEKIKELNDSRKLFLRNILHELKTPITKGKLVSDTLEDSKKKKVLQRAFLRLEFLLEEFVKLELLSSGKMNLEKKEYRIIDLLDQALDILLIDKSKVDIYPNGTKICVDFEVFSIALKNLIDNSLRYNTNGNPEIFIKEDSLLIKNQGDSLEKTFEEYLKPFNREYESIDRGLGLGLYIANSVIESHGYKLFYYYSKNYHIFKIQFESPL